MRSYPNTDFYNVSDAHIHVKMLCDNKRRPWYTSAYIHPEVHCIYYVEGGNSVISSQGIHWYRTVEEAKKFLKLFVLNYNFLYEFKNSQDKQQQVKIEKNSSASSTQDNQKVKRNQNNFNLNPSKRSNTFEKLMNVKNLQELYHRIFPGINLAKSVWKTKKSKGLFTTSFHSPAAEDKNCVYEPTECGGTQVDGQSWFYHSEKEAMCAAFYQFLLNCSKLGILDKSLSKTSSGKTLFM